MHPSPLQRFPSWQGALLWLISPASLLTYSLVMLIRLSRVLLVRVQQVCLYSLCQWLCSQHRYCLQFYCTGCQASFSLGWLAGTAVEVLRGRDYLELLIAYSVVALRKITSCWVSLVPFILLHVNDFPGSRGGALEPEGVGGIVWGDRSTKADNQNWWNWGIIVWKT